MMWRSGAAGLLALGLALAGASAARAQDAARVRMSSVPPSYPELARQMHLAGTVKVLITVSPEGKVTAARAVEGHPLLTTEAENCARQWHYLHGPKTSVFTVPVVFELE